MIEELDLKNKKILFELDKNSRVNLPQLARKVRLSKEVVFHRINNLVKREIIARFQAVISTYRLGYQSYKLYFKLQDINSAVRKKIENFFISNKKVYWLGNCQGNWDMIVAFWAKSMQEVAELEDEILNKFSRNIQERALTITRKSIQYNRRWFFDDKKEVKETTFGEDLGKIAVDEIDLRILKYIASNSRIKIVDLVELTKTSVPIVRYRLKQLEKNQIIRGYKIAMNSKLLGYETCKSFISLKNVTEEKREELVDYCRNLINCINIVQTLGAWDLEIEFEVKNFEDYYRIMNEMQEKFSNLIKSYDSVLFSSEPKQVFMPEN